MKKVIEKNERIFIAGSNGMVGSSIKRALLKNPFNQPNYFSNMLVPSRLELDLLDSISVKNWFMREKPNIVILAAAKVGGIHANSKYPKEFLLENIKIQTNVIEAALAEGVRRLLFLGSSCIYPKFSEQPIKEESLLAGPLEKTNEYYAIAKIAGIKLCESLRKQFNFDAICLMPTNLYGPGDNYHPENSHVMASLIKKFCDAEKNSSEYVTCWGTGSPLREFLHVEDLGDAVVFALEKWDPVSNNSPKINSIENLIYLNVGTGLDITIKDLSKKIAIASGFKGDILWDKSKPDGTPKKQLDITRFKKMGWKPKISLDEGIKDTIKKYKLKNLI